VSGDRERRGFNPGTLSKVPVGKNHYVPEVALALALALALAQSTCR
jgi:hypothetical protein